MNVSGPDPRLDEIARRVVAAYFTLAGDVAPGEAVETSAWPFEERLAAASAAGLRGFGIYHTDLAETSARLGLGTMRSMLDERGIETVELEFLGDWFTDGERRAESDERRLLLLQAAEALGARHIKAGGDFTGQTWPLERTIEEFRILCREAASAGTRIALEPMPFSSIVDLDDGLAIVEGAGDAAGGLCIDIWHLVRAGTPMERLARVPARWITTIELNDGPAQPIGSLWDDAVDNRTFCGEGDLPIREFLDALAQTGYDGPYGVEIMGRAYRKLPLDEVATHMFETTVRQIATR